MLYSPTNLKILIENRLKELIKSSQKIAQKPLEFNILHHLPTFASQKYISLKSKKALEMGILANQIDLTKFDTRDLIDKVKNLSEPYILQLPTHPSLNWILDQIPAKYDLDLLNSNNFSSLINKGILPPTIRAIFWVISDFLGADLDYNQGLITSFGLQQKNNSHIASKLENSKSENKGQRNKESDIKRPKKQKVDKNLETNNHIEDYKMVQNLNEKSRIPAKIHAKIPNIEIDFLSSVPNLKGKTVLIIGQGQLVGKPLVGCLLHTGATVISTNEWTNSASEDSLKNLAAQADIVISAIGKPNIIHSDMFRSGTFVIDAATAESGGVLVGDIDKNQADNIVLCPSPGGVGGLTILALFYNLYLLNQLSEF